jgi:LmbE family N-acetylglucosaminyl deacetylase
MSGISASSTFGSALVLFAHPDDAEFMCGGTIARWARDGCEVHYVVCTDGSAGSNEPGKDRDVMRPIREAEQRAAADVLGVKTVTFLGETDGSSRSRPRRGRRSPARCGGCAPT